LHLVSESYYVFHILCVSIPLIVTLHGSCGTVYCNRSYLFVGVCVWVGLLPR